MAQHGYIRDYDEDFRDQYRERGPSDLDRDWRDERRFMFHEEGDYGGGREQGAYARGRMGADDHYRSWRDRQMRALDREYEEYCREREEQFHRDFDNWRNKRRQSQTNELLLGTEHAATMGGPKPQASKTGRSRR